MIAGTVAHQKGVSLISLMVGLVISMIAILSMLAVFKTTLKVTGESGRGAISDGQRLAAFYTAQTLLQEAGYGIDTATFGTDILVVSGASLDASTKKLSGTLVSALPASGNAVIWRSKPAAANVCNGLYAPAMGGLRRLPATACTSLASEWNTIVWNSSVLVNETDSHPVSIAVTKTTGTSGCQSFGIGGSGGLWAKLTTANSTDLDTSATTCLSNFPVSS